MKIDSDKLKERIDEIEYYFYYDFVNGILKPYKVIVFDVLLKKIDELEKEEKNNYQERVISVTSDN